MKKSNEPLGWLVTTPLRLVYYTRTSKKLNKNNSWAICAWPKPRIAQVFLLKVEVVFSRESFFALIASEFHWRKFGT